MKGVYERVKKLLFTRRWLFTILAMAVIVGFFVTYIGRAFSEQTVLIPENPLNKKAQQHSQVLLASDYKDLLNLEKNNREDMQERPIGKEETKEKQKQQKDSKGKTGKNEENERKRNAPSKSVKPNSPNIEIIDQDHANQDDLKKNEFFTTTIKDQEIVTDKEYSFTIKQKDHTYIVKMVEVLLNQQVESQFNGHVQLAEGENTITITVTYRDAEGKVFSVRNTYTVYLTLNEIVIQSDLKKIVDVKQPEVVFQASAEMNGKELPLSVYLQDEKLQEETKHQYRAMLQEGKNEIVISASSGKKQAEKHYIITYHKAQTSLKIETELKNQQVNAASFSFSATAKAANESAKLAVTFNGQSISVDKNGKYDVTLKEGENQFTLIATANDETLTQEYVVTYVAPNGDQDGGAKEENKHAPTIETDIKDGDSRKGSIITFHVWAKDYTGKVLTSNDGKISVVNNGKAGELQWSDGSKSNYKVTLQNGKNTIVITAVDREGNSATKTYTINGTVVGDGETIGQVTISMEATTIGLGYLIAPVKYDIHQGKPASYVLDQLLRDYGFSYGKTGSLDRSFYLSSISKPGLVKNPVIPADLAEILEREMERFDPDDYKPNVLGEFDFTNGSGWMFSVNGVYPNVGFSDYYLRDGDVVRIRFTLAYGADIGGFDALGGPGQNYPKEW